MFCSVGYFPASGYRWRESGILRKIGEEGDSWGSSSCGFTSSTTRYLGFIDLWLHPLREDGRVYGFPVRCVQAFI
ncbi:hypothetical protein [Bacteroides sp.]